VARQRVEERFHDAIEFAVSEYGDHSRLTRAKVIRWLKQVSQRSRPLAAKVLQSIDYYADSNIHSMARQLAEATYAEYSEVKKGRIYFVPIGGVGSGAQQVARHLRSVRSVPKACVIDPLKLYQKPSEEIEVIVAFDDFSGTGQTIREWWDNNESIILPKQAELVVGLLVLSQKARPSLEGITEQIMVVDELLAEGNVFDQDCTRFSQPEKRALLTLCKKTGCTPEYVKGRGECGLLVVFKHGCPNNSLPILWHEKDGIWDALFQRRGT